MNWCGKKHLWINKYLNLKTKKYYLSFCPKRRIVWFRIYKCATRTIDEILRKADRNYIYCSQINYFEDYYRNWFKFVFMRDPVARFVSCYNDRERLGGDFCRIMNVDEFLDLLRATDLNSEKCDGHIRSQISMVDLKNVNFIGRLENFENDIKAIFPLLHKVPFLNRSNKVVKLTDNQIDEIRNIYKQDVEFISSLQSG